MVLSCGEFVGLLFVARIANVRVRYGVMQHPISKFVIAYLWQLAILKYVLERKLVKTRR